MTVGLLMPGTQNSSLIKGQFLCSQHFEVIVPYMTKSLQMSRCVKAYIPFIPVLGMSDFNWHQLLAIFYASAHCSPYIT